MTGSTPFPPAQPQGGNTPTTYPVAPGTGAVPAPAFPAYVVPSAPALQHKPDPMPTTEVEFHQMFRTAANPWWKGVVATVLFVVGYLIISTVLGLVAVGIDFATGRTTVESLGRGVILTPSLLLFTNITNFLAIPLSMLLQWWLWGQPVRWAHSVVGVVRWRLLARAAIVIVPLWVVLMLVPSLFVPGTAGFTWESVALLVIVLLTTPLQAAGEEYGARGLIARAAGSWIADPRWSLVVATVVSATLFCIAHGAGDPWLILFYFLFGVGMSILVWRTGGLEAAWLLHAVHNMCAFLGAIIVGQSLDLDRSAGTGSPVILLYIALIAVVVAVIWWRSRVEGVRRTYRPALHP